MRYPTISRENARYRGPMEARKFSKVFANVQHDLAYLFERIDLIKKDTDKTLRDTYAGFQDRTESMSYVNKENQFLKGGESRV